MRKLRFSFSRRVGQCPILYLLGVGDVTVGNFVDHRAYPAALTVWTRCGRVFELSPRPEGNIYLAVDP